MVNEDSIKIPNNDSLFSPNFRSMAAMAGWDEEALLIASLVVEDTPDRQHKKRSDLLHFKTPPVTVLDLDEEDTARQESEKKKAESSSSIEKSGKERAAEASGEKVSSVSSSDKKIESRSIEKNGADGLEEQASSSLSAFPCIDRLREELSCAICLDICFEPSTTPCGHSFCKKCLRSAADKCGKKCPKCRQLISNGRSCNVNTVLWNTIQLLFPSEIEARKTAGALNTREAQRRSPVRPATHTNRSPVRAATQTNIASSRTTRVLALNSPVSGTPSQDEDAALAQRLQREEFMQPFRRRNPNDEQYRNSLALARSNLRAMASRAINNTRVRGSGT